MAWKSLILFCALLYSYCTFSTAQDFKIGGTVGFSATIGTKINRAGLLAGGFVAYQNFQINSYWNGFYALNGFGPNLKRLESQLNFGLLGAFGPNYLYFSEENRQFFNLVSNHTEKKHSVTYVFKIYRDNIGTSQYSALMGFSIGRTGVYMENDLLITKGSDRYRTGAFSVMHQVENYQFGATSLLWTGNSLDAGTKRIKGGDSDYPSRHGYYDLSGSKYGKHSHGVLALTALASLPYRQSAGIRAGIDAEQVRHVLQNRILHDMPFVPRKLNKSINPHFPMLTDEGMPYVFKEGQKIRKPVFFGDVSVNPTLFY